MLKKRRQCWRLGILGALVVLGWALIMQWETWRTGANLFRAQQEIAQGRLDAARSRLESLALRPDTQRDAANYWLGICEALDGRAKEATLAFSRLPISYPFEPRGAYLEAKAKLALGRLRPAERRLEATLARGGPGLGQVFSLLGHIYEIQVRFDDAKRLLRDRLKVADDPLGVLQELSNFDLERLPYDGLKATLEKAGALAPEDDRVWLGKARLGIHAGRWDEAASWLQRCRDAGADPPVWRAWLEWARGCARPDEALEAASHLGTGDLEAGERLELLVLINDRNGNVPAELSALERWLEVEPTATRAMERLAELAHKAGQTSRVIELRRRKTAVERSLESYRLRLWRDEPLRSAAERAALGHLAEDAGHRHEARALYSWALKADLADPAANEGRVRLDRADAERRIAILASADLMPEPFPSTQTKPTFNSSGPNCGLAFSDDAAIAGLRFVYDNAETPIHQLPEPFGGGLALLDYDGDGWLDVFCVQGGPFDQSRGSQDSPAPAPTGDRLYRNRGDGTFEDVTEASGIARFPRGHGHGVTAGDIDGDGRTDLFVTRWRSYALYRNRGDGTFEDITDSSGLGGRCDWPTSAALADLDNDGDLDLYVCHYAVWDLDNPKICRDANRNAYLNCSPLVAEALPDHLFRNDGGRFVDVTAEAGIVDRDGRGLGVIAADLDGDGKVDLFVANDSSANFLFHNLGGMRFEEIGHESGVAGNASGAYQSGMGVAAGDLDGNGLIDLCVTNFYGESTTYFRNLGGGSFCDATEPVGLGVATRRLLGFGIALLDVDNDGSLDLASANGHVNDVRPNYPYRMPAQLLRGDGHRLTDVSERAGIPWQVSRMGRGLAVGDMDNDGRQDVLVLSHNEPLAYLHNRSDGGRFLTVRLEGRTSNRDAIGAKVAVVAGGRRRAAYRVGGGSYQSASDPRLHFGLGTADRVDLIEIVWPSGPVDRHRDLRADTGYLIREGDDSPKSLAGFTRDARTEEARSVKGRIGR